MAYVRAGVVKAAMNGDGVAAKARDERNTWVVGRASMLSGLVEAIVMCGFLRCGGGDGEVDG